jgi:hypothetical protein
MEPKDIRRIRKDITDLAIDPFKDGDAINPDDPDYEFKRITDYVFEVTVEDQTFRIAVKAIKPSE